MEISDNAFLQVISAQKEALNFFLGEYKTAKIEVQLLQEDLDRYLKENKNLNALNQSFAKKIDFLQEENTALKQKSNVQDSLMEFINKEFI